MLVSLWEEPKQQFTNDVECFIFTVKKHVRPIAGIFPDRVLKQLPQGLHQVR